MTLFFLVTGPVRSAEALSLKLDLGGLANVGVSVGEGDGLPGVSARVDSGSVMPGAGAGASVGLNVGGSSLLDADVGVDADLDDLPVVDAVLPTADVGVDLSTGAGLSDEGLDVGVGADTGVALETALPLGTNLSLNTGVEAGVDVGIGDNGLGIGVDTGPDLDVGVGTPGAGSDLPGDEEPGSPLPCDEELPPPVEDVAEAVAPGAPNGPSPVNEAPACQEQIVITAGVAPDYAGEPGVLLPALRFGGLSDGASLAFIASQDGCQPAPACPARRYKANGTPGVPDAVISQAATTAGDGCTASGGSAAGAGAVSGALTADGLLVVSPLPSGWLPEASRLCYFSPDMSLFALPG
ncbi:MAG: hypothetical protein QMC81_07720 [Thermoanaerobacterales bacterium]|nr:hypothetical protein [Thermoanaerobacterales bacterium]